MHDRNCILCVVLLTLAAVNFNCTTTVPADNETDNDNSTLNDNAAANDNADTEPVENENDNADDSVDSQTTTVDVGPAVAFTPADVTINVGDTVRWEWLGGLHNVVAGTPDSLEEDIFSSGEATTDTTTVFEVIFDQEFLEAHPKEGNVYPYVCVIHGSAMTGTVTVTTSSDE
jgi:plastocyanin